MSLARLWRDQGKVQQARELLATRSDLAEVAFFVLHRNSNQHFQRLRRSRRVKHARACLDRAKPYALACRAGHSDGWPSDCAYLGLEAVQALHGRRISWCATPTVADTSTNVAELGGARGTAGRFSRSS